MGVYFRSKFAISPIIGIILLIGISVFSVISFQNWNQNFQSSSFSDLESNKLNQIEIIKISDSKLYLRSENVVELHEIRINGVICNKNITLKKGINEIYEGSCLNNVSSKYLESILIVSNNSVINKKIFVKKECNPLILKNCNEIKLNSCIYGDGIYLIDVDESGPIDPFPVYCDMSREGGGWTLVLRGNGNKDTFEYNSPYWTNNQTLNVNYSYDHYKELKNLGFSYLNFSNLLLEFDNNGDKRYIILNKSASSLENIFKGPINQSYDNVLTRNDWLNVISGADLQPYCNTGGFNMNLYINSQVRIGFIGNNENECASPDSFIGFGGRKTNFQCPSTPSINYTTFGNLNCYSFNDQRISVIGSLFIR